MNWFWKYAFIISIFAFISCSINKKLTQTWNYASVTKNDKQLFELTTNDTMILEKAGLFRYDIAAANKHSNGIWLYKKDTLILTYYPEMNIRRFKIEKVNRNQLIIREKDITFKYNIR